MDKNKNIFTLIHNQIINIFSTLNKIFHNSFIKEYFDKFIKFIKNGIIYTNIAKLFKSIGNKLLEISFIKKIHDRYYLIVHENNTVDNRLKKIFTVILLGFIFAFITFIQPKSVTIIADGNTISYSTSYPLSSSVIKKFTEENNITNYTVEAGGGRFLGPSEIVEIKIQKNLVINYKDESVDVQTYAITLDELYEEQKTRLEKYPEGASFVSLDHPDASKTYLRDLKSVDVAIKTTKVESKEVVKKPTTEYKKDATLESGNRELISKGVEDIRTIETTTTYLDGKEYSSESKVAKITQEGKNTVYRLGTKPAAATTTAWDKLAKCESGGNWAANTGNGYYGGLQFHPQTWSSVSKKVGLGHIPTANLATKEEQIKVASYLQARSGWGQWPACSLKMGLRSK